VGTATNFLSIWNAIARDAAQARQLSLVETARLFVLVNVLVHDALQSTMASRYVFGLWRPVTAIRQADSDLNPATDADPTWLSLLTNPPYPSYAGNMATIGASAARALELAFGANDIPVKATWRQSGGQPDVTQDFPGLGLQPLTRGGHDAPVEPGNRQRVAWLDDEMFRTGPQLGVGGLEAPHLLPKIWIDGPFDRRAVIHERAKSESA
jgi:hypothetical protein